MHVCCCGLCFGVAWFGRFCGVGLFVVVGWSVLQLPVLRRFLWFNMVPCGFDAGLVWISCVGV